MLQDGTLHQIPLCTFANHQTIKIYLMAFSVAVISQQYVLLFSKFRLGMISNKMKHHTGVASLNIPQILIKSPAIAYLIKLKVVNQTVT